VAKVFQLKDGKDKNSIDDMKSLLEGVDDDIIFKMLFTATKRMENENDNVEDMVEAVVAWINRLWIDYRWNWVRFGWINKKSAWYLEKICCEYIRIKFLSGKRLYWVKELKWIYECRAYLLEFSGHGWLRRISNLSSIVDRENDFLKMKNGTYIMCNWWSRAVYVGETGGEFIKRLSMHFYDSKRKLYRKTYKLMRRVGFESWIMIPIMKNDSWTKKDRLRKEAVLMDMFVKKINDEFSGNEFAKGKAKVIKKKVVKDIDEKNISKSKGRKSIIAFYKRNVIKDSVDEATPSEEEVWKVVEVERR
jgi:hypothetical protein